jgi:hypothetical protein
MKIADDNIKAFLAISQYYWLFANNFAKEANIDKAEHKETKKR